MEWTYILTVLGMMFLMVRHYLKCKYRHWKEQSVPCVGGVLPIVGNMLPLIVVKKNVAQLYDDFYKEMKGYSMAGFYHMTSPCLLVRDPELVKTVLVEDFHNFENNDFVLDPAVDPLLSASPFFSNGEIWKTSRAQVTPIFSSGKLKFMFSTIIDVCSKMSEYLKKMEERDTKMEFETKDLFSKYTTEILARVAFGVEGESFNVDKGGPFHDAAEAMFKPSLMKGFKQMIIIFFPFLSSLLKIPIVPPNMDMFFRKVIKDVLKTRDMQDAKHNDFLQLIMQLRESGAKDSVTGMEFNEDSITAHAASFFTNGYETTSITLSFISYQLAAHPDIQQRLRNEVNEVIATHGGLTYESLGEMTYMEQVINESIRMFPVAGAQLKVCTRETELKGQDGLKCHVTPGTLVAIPVLGLHRDPQFWQDPEEFDPDRFSVERKQLQHKFTYMPFGFGPRSCFGMRMAFIVMKAVVATVIRNYNLELSPRTELPLQLNPEYVFTAAKGGIWVYLNPI